MGNWKERVLKYLLLKKSQGKPLSAVERSELTSQGRRFEAAGRPGSGKPIFRPRPK